ncbi:MAG TPA: DMT family transporter [Sphingomicrobium sp.]|nr:DMT family transporter [Sphingomicrobium sp.]
MATLGQDCFDRKDRDAAGSAEAYRRPMIRTLMNRSDWTILFALAVIWGGAFLFISVAVREVPPLTYVWLRLSLAAAALWLVLSWRGTRLGLPKSAWGAIAALALLNNVVPFALFGWGQTQIASGLASILNATTPIWGVVVAHLFTSDEKMSPRKLAGVLLGFGGVALMLAPTISTSLGGNALAQLACVTASLCYAVAGVWARRFRAMGVRPESVATGQLTVGALFMLPVALIADRPWLLPVPSGTAIAAIAALAIFCTALGYVLYFRLIDRAGATNALLVTLLVPPVAILLGALFLGEVLHIADFAGLALIALGLAAIDGRLLSLAGPRRLQRAT